MIEPVHLDTVSPTDGLSRRTAEIPHWVTQLARLILRLTGWKLYGEMPNADKCVIAAAWHTSNWDGLWMLLTAWAFGVRPVWMVKHEWTKGAVGGIVKALGGMGIDRSRSQNTVDEVVQQFASRDHLALVIAPEGTRRKAEYWKAGFYWMAHGANVPLVLSFLDYPHHRLGIGGTITPTGDIEADMERIWAFYRQITPRDPDKKSDMRLRPAQIKHADTPPTGHKS